ncbi:MAG: hypothetical protein HY538_02995 [Deltaproteobacteria bacterium]|nr:hypothetical protein [Deltaproteobacteria bacterium]
MPFIFKKWGMRRLGSFLLQEKAIDRDQLKKALELQEKRSLRLGSLLVDLGYVSLERMAFYLSQSLQIPYAHPQILENIHPDVIKQLPRPIAMRCKAIPIEIHKNRLRIAMVDPWDKRHQKVLARATGLELEPMIAPQIQIEKALQQYYSSE